ncbi:hypothetical protein [Endozoicomonas euniceicola]|uniref:Uncharacterized protein n=1 Tax=Endozoicomonas euniceicola TaxID=1234143 RepID=A0ABY6GSA8_9GAMM|nr:hypothetical protein [Endozoicomonas euniceicola]UYM14968.1 hypothetical protein NX720_19055 [Endozoicomonas euniceicola]
MKRPLLLVSVLWLNASALFSWDDELIDNTFVINTDEGHQLSIGIHCTEGVEIYEILDIRMISFQGFPIDSYSILARTSDGDLMLTCNTHGYVYDYRIPSDPDYAFFETNDVLEIDSDNESVVFEGDEGTVDEDVGYCTDSSVVELAQ